MKTIHLLKLTTFSILLIAASILACTDHVIPDPGSNCALINGSPRSYPCEFEITKAEFCKGLEVNNIIGTVAQDHPDITLPFKDAWFNFSPLPSAKNVTYKVKLHIKRIANPSVKALEGYIIDGIKGTPTDVLDRILGEFPLPVLHPQVPLDLPDLKIGDSTVFITDAEYHIELSYLPPFNTPVYSNFTGNVLFLLHNISTSKTLIAPPHNYKIRTDLAEAHILIKPTFVD